MSQLFSWSRQGEQNRSNGWRKIFLSLLCWGLSGTTACGWPEDQRIGWESSLCPFVAQSDISRIKERLAQGADPNGFCDYSYGGQYLIGKGIISQPLLWTALQQENSQVAELLIQAGADVNAANNLKDPGSGYTPLYMAVNRGDLQLVKLMLANGAKANPADDHPSPLVAAIRIRRLDLIKLLLAAGANPNAYSDATQTTTLLQSLIAADQAFFQAAATLLLANGAEINRQGQFGNPTLFYTVNQSQFQDVTKKAQFLLDRGAKIDAQNSEGVSPLLAAASTNLKYSPQLVGFLVTRGAKVNLSDRDGNTALHYLAWSANPEAPALIKLMIERGVDVNAQNKRGDTPLHNLADSQQPVQKAEILITHGAKINLQNQQAETPLSLAQAQGNTELIQFLQSRSSAVRQGRSPR